MKLWQKLNRSKQDAKKIQNDMEELLTRRLEVRGGRGIEGRIKVSIDGDVVNIDDNTRTFHDSIDLTIKQAEFVARSLMELLNLEEETE